MHKTLKAFLEGTHEDAADQIAQRALLLHAALSGPTGMIANAYQRGDAEAHQYASHAHYQASAAFVVVNAAKQYPFAAEVLERMPEFQIVGDVGSQMQVVLTAAHCLETAESIAAAFEDRCAPTYGISGCNSVRILRGFHAAQAAQGLVPANLNVAA
jgi:hypothetical protein